MGFEVVSGIQSQGVVANAKHWVNNNQVRREPSRRQLLRWLPHVAQFGQLIATQTQETDRHYISENVDERTQFELYYPPFEGGIQAGLGSIMCSYNLICVGCTSGQVGNWSCENDATLRVDLKQRLNFSGWVMSDWTATHSTSIDRGLDQEMPGASHMNNRSISTLLQSGEIDMSKVRDSAWRILWPLFAVGAFDKVNNNTAANDVRTPRNSELARNFSTAGTVLLKNDGGLLPIHTAGNSVDAIGHAKDVKSITVIGEQAVRPIVTGGGSGAVSTRYVISPLVGICARLGVPIPSNAEDSNLLKYGADTSMGGMDVVTLMATGDFKTTGGAAVTHNPLSNLRSGSPHSVSTATLSAQLASGVTVDSFSFAYRYETGFHGNASCGVRFNLTVAGALVYDSPLLTAYPYSHSNDGYSPPVVVDKQQLGIIVNSSKQVEFTFENDCLNVQLLLPMVMNFSCSSAASCFATPLPPAPTPPGAPSCTKDGVCVYYASGKDIAEAQALAATSDVALIFTGTTSKEGTDRANLNLGADDALIANISANPATGAKTAVIVVTPGAVLTDWRDQVGAVLTTFMPGEEYGHAIASILWNDGDNGPSGRLPVTFPAIENEVNFSIAQWPGVHKANPDTPCLSWHDTGGCSAVYSEGLLVGYRWYAAHPEVVPAYAFGAGLTYAGTFAYSDLKLDAKSKTISCTVTNNGTRGFAGRETAQLYLRFPPSAGEPPHQLKGWHKLPCLYPGEAATATFRLESRSFSIWDTHAHTWQLVTGEFGVMVGAASDDIRLTSTLNSEQWAQV